MKLFLATGNAGKAADFAGLGLQAAGIGIEALPGFASLPPVEETGASFEANARLKAEAYSQATSQWVVADDSGLEVAALNGAPGIFSARFAGRHGDDAANNRRLLERLREVPPERRAAAFVCVLALARRGKTVAAVTGRAVGAILEKARGGMGFGYDPLFYSPEAGCSFGELAATDKARFSHRGRAVRALVEWIRLHPEELETTWLHHENPPLR